MKREAEQFAARIELDVTACMSTRPLTKTKVTIEEAVRAVLAPEEHKLKPRTFDSYRKLYNNRIVKTFGHRRITSITRSDSQGWIGDLVAAGLASPTVRHYYLALRKLFNWAIVENLVAGDPCTHVALPKATSDHEYPILTVLQIERLSAELSSTPPYGLLVRFMALTGLRVGECSSRTSNFGRRTSE